MSNLIRLAEKDSTKRFEQCLQSEAHPPQVLAEALVFGQEAKALVLPGSGELAEKGYFEPK